MSSATFTNANGTRIEYEPFRPAGNGPHPAIVIAYGTQGLEHPFGRGIRYSGKGHGFTTAFQIDLSTRSTVDFFTKHPA